MECNENYQLFSISAVCFDRYADIVNCKTYSNTGTCQACKDGFFLNQNTCDPLGSNCKDGTSNTVCTTCNDNYGLNNDDKCMSSFNYLA